MILHLQFLAPYLKARFGQDERGASLVEYALLVALIAVVCVGAVSALGGKTNDKFTEVSDSLDATTTTAVTVP